MMIFRERALRRPSLYAGVLASVLFVCGALVGLDGWRTWQARAVFLAEDKAETANLARSLAQHAHDLVQSADTILRGVRERVAMDGLAPDSLARLHRHMMSHVAALPLVHGLFLYDAEGKWLASSLPSVPVGVNSSDRDYFQYHRTHADQGVYVGHPVHSKADGQWIIPVSRRVDDSAGKFAGVALATISIDYLNQFYSTFSMGRQGIVSLVLADGTLILRNPASEASIGKNVAGNQIFRDYLPHAPVGSFSYRSALEGVDRLGSYRRVEAYPLVVVVAHGLDDVLASWRSDAKAHLAVSVILAAALGCLGFRFARHIKTRQETERRYRLLADNSSDAITCTSLDGRRRYVSPAFTSLTGWSASEALSQVWMDLVHHDDRYIIAGIGARLRAGGEAASATYRYICKSGGYLWVEAKFHLVPAMDGEEAQFVANIRDVTARKAAEEKLAAANEELARQANTDALTGLANRRRFDEALDTEWQRAARAEEALSLLLIDVDRFKRYNDRYGHLEGDGCLRAVAAAIDRSARRPADLCARYGGEEIVVLLPGTDADGAARVAETVRAAIEAAGIAHEGNLPAGVVTASIGVATMLPQPNTAERARTLVAAADAALYEAKRTGRNRVVAAGDVPVSSVAPMPADEARRLDVLAQYEAAGALARSEGLDRVARLTASLFRVPIALVSLVGRDEQCFAGRVGLDADSTLREVSFCAHTMAGDDVFTVADATRDARFAENSLVTGDPGIRFYAGAPLLSPLGQPLGALCIIDRVPRPPLTSPEKVLLADFAALAASYMERTRVNQPQAVPAFPP